jgi:hypothetical protein
VWCRFGVSGFDQHRRASCGVTSIDVFRTVADQKGAGQEQPMLGRGIWNRPGRGFLQDQSSESSWKQTKTSSCDSRYDDAGNVIETHEHAGDFKES